MGLENKLEAAIPRIIERVRREIEPQAIYIFGSALDPTRFREGDSDLDVLVIADGLSFKTNIDVDDIKGPWSRIEMTLRSPGALLHREFELSFIARALRGVCIYGSVDDDSSAAMSREEARADIALGMLKHAAHTQAIVGDSVSRKFGALYFDTRWLIARSAGFAMQGYLTMHDVDIAPKSIRWNLVVLAEMVAARTSALSHLPKLAAVLPRDLSGMDEGDLLVDDPTPIAQARKELAAALKIIRACRRELGFPRNPEDFVTRMRRGKI